MISKHRYCLSRTGEVVLATDARAFELLVGEGCEIPEDAIKRYGFVNGELPKTMPVESKEGTPKEVNLANLVTNIVDLQTKQPKPKSKDK